MELSGTQPLYSGMDDLESFQECLEKIKLTMTQENPSLDVVLGEIASSKQPIAEGNIFQVLQSILKDKIKHLECFKRRERESKLQRKRGSSASAY